MKRYYILYRDGVMGSARTLDNVFFMLRVQRTNGMPASKRAARVIEALPGEQINQVYARTQDESGMSWAPWIHARVGRSAEVAPHPEGG